MKTRAVRLYGKNDLRLEHFELPPIKQDEILCSVISDSICMSSYKAAILGAEHKRVPNNVADNPIIIGHEFCGDIIEVGSAWAHKYRPGQKYTIQPAMFFPGSDYITPGYAWPYCGGNATYVIMPREIMEHDCLITYNGNAYFYGSLAEPLSCLVGAFRAAYHTPPGSFEHIMGIREGGRALFMAAAGPMGLGAIDYALNAIIPPSLLVVADIDGERLNRAASIYTKEYAKERGVALHYIDTSGEGAYEKLMALSQGSGYDDIMVFAAVKQVVEMADALLGRDGCLNFFAGPTDTAFSADINFYNIHYNRAHIIGTSGGNADDMRHALELMSAGRINPSPMITHIGGLDSAIETTLNLPSISGGKKLVYTHILLPLTAISDFGELGKNSRLFAGLDSICSKNNGIWNAEAEEFLLANAESSGTGGIK
ncbi:MAG: zinc-binding dehydrogenase [Christensenellales bacterium]